MVKMEENVETGPMDQHGMVIGDKAQLEVIQVKWFRRGFIKKGEF